MKHILTQYSFSLLGYYSPGMEAIQLDGDILFGLLKKVCLLYTSDAADE